MAAAASQLVDLSTIHRFSPTYREECSKLYKEHGIPEDLTEGKPAAVIAAVGEAVAKKLDYNAVEVMRRESASTETAKACYTAAKFFCFRHREDVSNAEKDPAHKTVLTVISLIKLMNNLLYDKTALFPPHPLNVELVGNLLSEAEELLQTSRDTPGAHLNQSDKDWEDWTERLKTRRENLNLYQLTTLAQAGWYHEVIESAREQKQLVVIGGMFSMLLKHDHIDALTQEIKAFDKEGQGLWFSIFSQGIDQSVSTKKLKAVFKELFPENYADQLVRMLGKGDHSSECERFAEIICEKSEEAEKIDAPEDLGNFAIEFLSRRLKVKEARVLTDKLKAKNVAIDTGQAKRREARYTGTHCQHKHPKGKRR